MLKNILKLEGAQKLSKNEQKSISGGIPYCALGCFRNPDLSQSCEAQGYDLCCISGWCQY
jgi:hypothetical protein